MVEMINLSSDRCFHWAYRSGMLLPQELVDRIIDQLHEDKSVLAACTLVNKHWLYRSRHHLFHTITLRGDKENTFPDFTHSQTRGVRPFCLDVRHVRFFQCKPSFPSCEQSIPLSHELISRFAFFPHVNALTISVAGPIDPTTSSILHSVFGHVTNLVLRNLRFPDISNITFLLSGFPALETLDLQVDFVTRHNEEQGQLEFSIPVSTSLRSLELDSWPSGVLYPWLSSPHQKLSKLTCLALVLDDHDPKHVGNFFAKLGPQLEKLVLTMDDIPDPLHFTSLSSSLIPLAL
jgi:hypothetical protein